MSEDPTRGMPGSFEERILAEFASLNARFDTLESRLTALEEKVDAWLRETRPIWEGVQQRLTEIEKGLDKLNRQFRIFVADAFDLRSRVDKLEDEATARES